MIVIRHARAIDRKSLREMYLSEVENHDERATAFAKDLIKRFKTLLALDNSKLCGTLTWDTRGGLDDGVVEIISLGINTTHKRRGIATKLVESLITEASQFYSDRGYALRVIILFMESRNNDARKFYTHVGFSEIARIPDLYPHDDGVIWVRHL